MNIYDLAKECGTSVSTVSKVINGLNGVGDELRAKVEQKIKENGFVPKISKTASDSIAVFINYAYSNSLTNSFILAIISGISEIVFENKFIFTIIANSSIPSKESEYKHFCAHHRIGGAVFVAPGTRAGFVRGFAKIVPTAVVGSYFDDDNLVCIGADNKSGALGITDYILSMGHKRIAFAVADLSFQDHSARYEGYKEALRRAGIAENKNLLLHYDYDHYRDTSISAMLNKMLADKSRSPTAIFCCNDQEVYRLSAMLETAGYKTPSDISIAGFDDYELSKYFNPPLTTVKQPLNEEGRIAADVICRAIKDKKQVSGEHIILPTRLVVRDSVGRI